MAVPASLGGPLPRPPVLPLPSVQVASPAPLKAQTLADSGRGTLRSGAVGARLEGPGFNLEVQTEWGGAGAPASEGLMWIRCVCVCV